MFDSKDIFTQKALLELRDIRNNGKPVILWIGAGASRWAGYPTWNELAEKLNSQFIKYEAKYDSYAGKKALEQQTLPLVFSLCKQTNSSRYLEILSKELRAKTTTPVYSRFIELLNQISPLSIITTNVDENLESNLTSISTYQRSNIEFAEQAVSTNQSFICKIHGTASAIETSIWTDEDYDQLIDDEAFIANLRRLLGRASIVFVGYGLRDEYVLGILSRNHSMARLLGDGPHFLVSSETSPQAVPESVKVIRYLTSNFSDHRGALAVLDLLRNDIANSQDIDVVPSKTSTSAIYLPDYMSYGNWTTSQTVTFSNLSGKPCGRATVGNGFVQSEMKNLVSTALHDLLVGLMCFDQIYFPLHGLGRLYSDLGRQVLWELINSNTFRFVWRTSDLAVVFGEPDSVSDGAITSLTIQSRTDSNLERSLEEVLSEQLPAESKTDESRANLHARFESITVKIDESILSKHPRLVESALLLPRLRTSIGLGDAILPSKIPDWFIFPVLRVAAVVQDAEICRLLEASAAKMPFGSDALANATYGISATKQSAGNYANYVITGRFQTNLGEVIINQPELLQKVLRFRESSEGQEFRKEIFDQLQTNDGSEFVASVNSMLKSVIAFDVLERARGHFSNVYFSANNVSLLSGSTNEIDPFLNWRKHSADKLRSLCRERNIGPYDFCPCGSGDKLKFCCGILFHQ